MKLQEWIEFLVKNDIQIELEKHKPWVVDVNGTDVSVYTSIELKEGNRKITGYMGFMTSVLFDENEEFLGIGAWE
jgi:argininosuccinate synthase